MRNPQSSPTPPALPSLNALRAFEAVSRLGGVAQAASDLCVTPGAVSHQLSQLEGWFGRELLARDGRGLRLTEAGRDLSERIAPAFAAIGDACASVREGAGRELHLAAPGSFLARWLVPRLEAFEREHPGVRLRLRTDGGIVDLRARRLDALVECRGGAVPADLDEIRIAPERIGPVCSPRLAASPRTAPRLSTDSRPEAWSEWEALSGWRPGRSRSRAFDHLVPLLEAAKAGLGVAIVPEILVEREVAAGELAAPFGFRESGRRFSLLRLRSRSEEPPQRVLAGWIADPSRLRIHPPGR